MVFEFVTGLIDSKVSCSQGTQLYNEYRLKAKVMLRFAARYHLTLFIHI